MFQAGNVEMIALMGPFINDCSRDRFGKECMQYISKISVESKWQKIHIKRFLGKFIAIALQIGVKKNRPSFWPNLSCLGQALRFASCL